MRITGPGVAYEYVYDARQVDLQKIAYDFEYELENWQVDPHVYQELVAAVEEWQRRHASPDKPFLYYSKALTMSLFTTDGIPGAFSTPLRWAGCGRHRDL